MAETTKDLLLEIGCEEMPSAPLMHAQRQLGELVDGALTDAGLAHGAVSTLSTPRRLTVMVAAVATATEEISGTNRGPATRIAFAEDGTPTKAAQGFARKMGVDPIDLIRRVDDDGREYVFAEHRVASRPAAPLLSALCEDAIASLEWPNYRSQRWGNEHQGFVRPIRWICCLLGTDVVPVRYAGVESSNTTRGHRVMGPGEHVVPDAAHYVDVLHDAYVMGERERGEVIRAGVAEVEAARGGAHVDMPRRIFDEVVNLTEWPHVLVGTFDEGFLDVPPEIICDSMLSNQRYFPLYDANGMLTREFVVVSNADPAVDSTVIDGNERVVRARLDDAKFFFEEDLKHPLEDFVERLSTVTFQERLGTVLQKTHRMERIAPAVMEGAGHAEDAPLAARAAHLSKADLVSQAVVEFTNQQGVMGGYYARAQGEPDEVARAIREHYRPRFAGDELPSGRVGKAVAIADKLDTVCGIFAIDEAPTGSSDPFAVRRAAIGCVALLRELPTVSLARLVSTSLDAYLEQGLSFDKAEAAGRVRDFFKGRLRIIARDEGISPDIIDAVSAVDVIDPAEFLARGRALQDAHDGAREVFEDLATAYTRAAHLADASLGTAVDVRRLGSAERALLDACERGDRNVKNALSTGAYGEACAALAELRGPIDRFFDDVLVMDEDTGLRENRLRLLNRFAAVFADVADIGFLSRTKG